MIDFLPTMVQKVIILFDEANKKRYDISVLSAVCFGSRQGSNIHRRSFSMTRTLRSRAERNYHISFMIFFCFSLHSSFFQLIPHCFRPVRLCNVTNFYICKMLVSATPHGHHDVHALFYYLLFCRQKSFYLVESD